MFIETDITFQFRLKYVVSVNQVKISMEILLNI